MRVLSIILWIAAACAVVAWALGYVWISAMACGFATTQARSCPLPLPWHLVGEDLLLMVLLPGGLVLALMGLAILTGRAGRR